MLNGKSENYEESRKTVAKLCEHCHLHKIHHRVMTLQGSRAQTAKMLGPVLIYHNQSDDCYWYMCRPCIIFDNTVFPIPRKFNVEMRSWTQLQTSLICLCVALCTATTAAQTLLANLVVVGCKGKFGVRAGDMGVMGFSSVKNAFLGSCDRVLQYNTTVTTNRYDWKFVVNLNLHIAEISLSLCVSLSLSLSLSRACLAHTLSILWLRSMHRICL
jgi:hypothetical protein